jgi:hypothetical protein
MCCLSAGAAVQEEFLERLQEENLASASPWPEWKQMLERLREENRASASPWPECKRCGFAVDWEDMNWLFPHHCDSHGLAKLDSLLRKIARRHGRRRTLRILKRLAR